jgi:hypothetical protein
LKEYLAMKPQLLITLAMLWLAACNPSPPSYTVTDPKTGEKSQISVNTKEGKESVSVKSKTGEGTISVTESGDVPKNMPAFLPPYPGASYKGSFAANMKTKPTEGAQTGGMVSFQTTDEPDKVFAFYKNAFTKAGLTESASGEMGGMEMISFSKGANDQEGVQVLATREAGAATQVQIMYSFAP